VSNLLDTEKHGKLEYIESFAYYDGEVHFSVKDMYEQIFHYIWVDEDDDGNRLYVVFKPFDFDYSIENLLEYRRSRNKALAKNGFVLVKSESGKEKMIPSIQAYDEYFDG